MNKWRLLISKIYRFFFPIDIVTMYRKMGVKIGNGCKIESQVMIDYAHNWLVTIGDHVTIAPRVHILAHDASTKNELGFTKLGLVEIQDNVFIGAGSIVLPGITIGKNSVIGAGSVVVKDIPENSVAAGNPCRVVGNFDDYITKQKSLMLKENCFDKSFTVKGAISEEKKRKMIDVLKIYKNGFVE
jgi:maltose O-acetyltransferase